MTTTSDRRNGSGFEPEKTNALLLFAALFPQELSECLVRAVMAEQPLSVIEHAERVRQLTQRITELSYIECALIERNGGEHDPQAEPMCVLGVRIGEAEAGEAAA